MRTKETKHPLVSVVLPAYRAAATIGPAIESILTQTYDHFELIIIDDCSPDKTWDLIETYSKKDRRIRAYRNEHNLGIGGNRARGIELAKGDFICWQDSDDISLPRRIELQVACLVANPNVGVVGGYIELFGEGMRPSIRKYAPDDQSLRKSVFRYNPVAQPASMFRKACYETLGTYDESYKVSEDLEMLLRVGTKYEFANVQEVVLKYRQDDNSLTRANLRAMELTAIRLRLKYSRTAAYHPSAVDYIYNILQLISVFIVPPKLKIALFNKFRNAK